MVKVLAALLLFPAASLGAALCLSCHKAHYNEEYECASCHGGIAGTTRKEIAHYRLIEGKYAYFLLDSYEVRRGGEIIDALHCRRCHMIDGKGGALAANLDDSIKRLTAAAVDADITAPNLQMPQFNLSPRDSAYVANALLSYSRKRESENMIETAQLGVAGGAELFNEKCGGCHKMLSNSSALGKHTRAPFLSGLYSEYYPPLAVGGQMLKWNEKQLSKWITNPRSVKPEAIMPPIKLTDKEKAEIMVFFEGKK